MNVNTQVLLSAWLAPDWLWPKQGDINAAVFEVTREFFDVVRRRQQSFERTRADDAEIRAINYGDKRLIWLVHPNRSRVIEETPRLVAGDEHLPQMARIEVREPEMCVTEWGIEWNGCPTYEDGGLGTGFRVHTSLLSWEELELLEAELIKRQT
jgi:hypothetical protein